jgi:N-acyl-D-aspartate/D-glutamate deacylase
MFMVAVRTAILIILWLGLMAGASSAVLDDRVSDVLGIMAAFIFGWLFLRWMSNIGGRRTSPRAYRYRGKPTKGEIAQARREYDADRAELARSTGSDYWFDSYGYKRDPYSGEYLYMNRTNTPNGDAFAGWADREIEYDGGEVYADENGNFWREV